MPNPADNESDEKVYIDPSFAFTIAPKWYVDVVTQKFTQGYMPSSPKLLNVDRFIGRVEVLGQFDIE